MTLLDLEPILAKLAESDTAVRQTIQDLSPAEWQWKPDPATWSIAEGAEHLVMVEQSILFRLRTAGPEGLEKTGGKQPILDQLPLRSQRFAAPPRLISKGSFADPAACLAAFTAARTATLAWAQSPDTHLLNHVMPHPFFGELHGAQWLDMIAGHALRHVNQMRELMALEGYPKATGSATK
jgi:uncharacterized damage-inducible protein DinB